MLSFNVSTRQVSELTVFLTGFEDAEDSLPPKRELDKKDPKMPRVATKEPENSGNDGIPVLANNKIEDTGSDISDAEEAGYCDDSSTDDIYIRMKLEPIKDRELKNLYNNTDEVSIGIKTIDLTSVLLQQ